MFVPGALPHNSQRDKLLMSSTCTLQDRACHNPADVIQKASIVDCNVCVRSYAGAMDECGGEVWAIDEC